jgi:ubiquinone/menaquinone biosynthesis C-methylase UbiE
MSGEEFLSTLERAILEQIRPDQRILDIGCANGRVAVAVAERAGAVTGLDSSETLFNLARMAARQAGVHRKVRCVKGDAHELPFEAASFDGAIMVDTLHHLERPELAVAEARRVLKPGGLVIVAEVERQPGEPVRGCNRYTRRELIALLANAGFTSVRLRTTAGMYMAATAREAMGARRTYATEHVR